MIHYKLIFKPLSLILLVIGNLSFSQDYDVSVSTKINELSTNFNQTIESEDWFGYTVEGIGDINGDGIYDVAVSSLQDDDGGFNRGAVYIIFLTSDGAINATQKIADNTGGFTGVLDDWDIFGTSISFLGDMNSDGKIEIAVGTEYDGDGGFRQGAVWILSLNADGTVFSQQKISSLEGNFSGDLDTWDVFGTDIENLGDLNNDGFDDIAVGARRDGDGGTDRGAVWILFLNSDFTVNNYQKISSTSGGFTGSLNNEDYFGGSVANLGDINNDGVIDIAVGAYRDDDGGTNKGAIYILFLNSDGTVASHQKISETEGGFTDVLFENSRFGKSIDLFFDINEDGKKEILVGSSGYENNSNTNEGSFYIINLNSNGTVDAFHKYATNLNNFTGTLNGGDYFGFSVSTIGDLNGQASIIVGAFGDSELGFQKGAAWILKLKKVLSVEEVDNKHNIKVYPNPTNTSFSLNLQSEGDFIIHIIDMNGRLIKNIKSNSENVYDVSSLNDGVYLVNIMFKNSNQISTFKLIKQ